MPHRINRLFNWMPKKHKKTKEGKSTKKEGYVSYSAKDIYVLEGLEPVQKRPGMYIGSTGPDGLHHLVWEVVDNSIDEAMAGYAKNITVELLANNKVAVTDDGRGIPVETHKQTKKSALETVMTTLHAGGKFGGESYKVSGGLHGVGVSVVNALSDWLRVEVCRDGGLYAQEYERGEPEAKVKKIGACKQAGTKVIFSPDSCGCRDVQSASFPGRVSPSNAPLRNTVSLAALAAMRALAVSRTFSMIRRASLGRFSKNSLIVSFITVSTAVRASGFPSRAFVCPSNCGSRSFTDNIAINPSRVSSLTKFSSFSFKYPSARA